jgi:hypothetical protein
VDGTQLEEELTKEELLKQISELKGALALITSDIATQDPTSDALDEFQSVVDGTRRSVWTVLKAMNTDDYQEYVAGFRVRRASGVLKAVMEDLDAGVEPDGQSVEALRDALDSVITTGPVAAIGRTS